MEMADSELRTKRTILQRIRKRLVVPVLLRAVDAFLTAGDCNEQYYLAYGARRRQLFRSPYPMIRTVRFAFSTRGASSGSPGGTGIVAGFPGLALCGQAHRKQVSTGRDRRTGGQGRPARQRTFTLSFAATGRRWTRSREWPERTARAKSTSLVS